LTDKRGRTRDRAKVGNNTYAHRRGDDVAIQLHATDVATFHPDGTITLDSGGWLTVTTKARMNDALPAPLGINSVDGVWEIRAGTERVATFFDGITLAPGADGDVIVNRGDGPGDSATDTDKATKRDVNRYLRGMTADVWADVMANARDKGTAGDCLYCQLAVNDVDHVGFGGTDHLRSHLEERYYMATLAYSALAERGYREPAVILDHVDMVKRALRRYLYARLLTGPTSGRRPTAAVSEHWDG